jgi:hypothetical protein
MRENFTLNGKYEERIKMKFKNIYSIADVEGVAGLTFYECWDNDMSMLNYELLHRQQVSPPSKWNIVSEK